MTGQIARIADAIVERVGSKEGDAVVRTRAAVLYEAGQPFQVQEIELDEPKAGEVLVHIAATGLCHSDWHAVTGDLARLYYPVVLGHEGAGVVERVGPGVTETSGIKPGDHVILTFIPSCGRCRFCSMGQTMLCDLGANILAGPQLDGSFRMHADGADLGQFCLISTFSEYTVCPVASCVVIPEDLPLDKVCLVGCGVPTGFGSAVNRADVQPGETVAIFGIGGVGINAVQGAAIKGAARIVAVDPVEFKLEMAEEMGATHTVNPNNEDPVQRVLQLTDGVGADKAIVTIGVVQPEHVGNATKCIRKGGRVVVTGTGPLNSEHVDVNVTDLVLSQKEVLGTLYGASNPRTDLPRYLELYRIGKLKVDELITKTYTLDQINEGYQDMLEGRIIKGVIDYGRR